jgi:polyphosphate kinase
MKTTSVQNQYFDRDISWLAFNERVLMEAEKEEMPLAERLKFLAIYSSNLDEFYRVRIASLLAMEKLNNKSIETVKEAKRVIETHQQRYGKTLSESIIPALKKYRIEFLYNTDIPIEIQSQVSDYFYTRIARFLHVINVNDATEFFTENNKIFFAVAPFGNNDTFIVNIPSDHLNRFHTITVNDKKFVLTIDDIIRQHLHVIFNSKEKPEAFAFKVTRDAELNLKDEVAGNPTRQLQRLLAKRDFGLATRFLYDATMPDVMLKKLIKRFKLKGASKVAGGRYHNLKDFFSFPSIDPSCTYTPHVPVSISVGNNSSVFSLIEQGDLMIHTPYHSYDLVLRFFSEAAIDPSVEKIYITLYRIAVQSGIAQALTTAALNGKKVTVMVELKARFDEENNIQWAKKMKAAGVKIIYSSPRLKVHAKIAMIKRKVGNKRTSYGLLSTGNFNENTARLYTDHILFTAQSKVVKEIQTVFKALSRQEESLTVEQLAFDHLIVAPFNIRERFFSLIDREISNAKQKLKASIMIKLNNLEEETLISKLYEASAAV